MKGQTKLCLIPLLLLMLLLSITACNVYDGFYSDDESGNVSQNLANADKAMAADDYAKAASLYYAVIVADNDNARARIGYSSAILLRDVEVRDIPALMNAVYSIETNSTNDFLIADLAGRPGLTTEQYKDQVMAACSNAAYWRSPVLGVDPTTGQINTNSANIPVATASDSWVPADDRTVMLNYLILRTVHIALYVQKTFKVSEGLVASINLADYTNFSITMSTTEAEFVAFHKSLTNQISQLSNSYESLTNVLLTRTKNISPYNLMDVAKSLLSVVSNSGFDAELLGTASQTITNLTSSIDDFVFSITNTSSGINQGFAEIYVWRTNVEQIASAMPGNWLDY